MSRLGAKVRRGTCAVRVTRTATRLARLTASTVGLYLSATAGLRRRLVIAQTRRELDALRERGLEHLARGRVEVQA